MVLFLKHFLVSCIGSNYIFHAYFAPYSPPSIKPPLIKKKKTLENSDHSNTPLKVTVLYPFSIKNKHGGGHRIIA